MNDLTNITGNGPVTMSSREIAELVNSRHDKVKQSIERLAERGVIVLPPMGDEHFSDAMGRPRSEKVYRIGKRDSYVIVAQLSPEFTARLVDRWQELESGAANMATAAALNDPAKLRHLLLENVEKVLALEAELGEIAPQAAAYEHLTRSDGTMCITDAAKALDMRPKDLFAWLQSNQWIYRRAGNGHFVGYQPKIQQGLLDHRLEEVTRADGSTKITEQVRVTAKGMAKLGELLARKQAA
jgi:phage regulator Rha-like protein